MPSVLIESLANLNRKNPVTLVSGTSLPVDPVWLVVEFVFVDGVETSVPSVLGFTEVFLQENNNKPGINKNAITSFFMICPYKNVIADIKIFS